MVRLHEQANANILTKENYLRELNYFKQMEKNSIKKFLNQSNSP